MVAARVVGRMLLELMGAPSESKGVPDTLAVGGIEGGAGQG